MFVIVVILIVTANAGSVKFSGNWVPFLDSLLHLFLIRDLSSDFRIPIGITKVEINPKYILANENDGEYTNNTIIAHTLEN